jgi:hypothetical protein
MRLKNSDTSVVISTNNGIKYLHDNLKLINNNNPNQNVIVVDTGSTDYEFIFQTKKLCEKLNFTYIESKYKMFDFSSIKTIIENDFNFNKYFFQHDNLIARSDKTYDIVFKSVSNNQPFVWCGFYGIGVSYFDNDEQFNWCNSIITINKLEPYVFGIFGPIFGITKEDLFKIEEIKYVSVNNKNEQRGTERLWSQLFTKYNIKPIIYSVVPNVDYAADKLPLFIKYFERRNESNL